MTEHIHTLKYEYFVMYYGIEGIVVGKVHTDRPSSSGRLISRTLGLSEPRKKKETINIKRAFGELWLNSIAL